MENEIIYYRSPLGILEIKNNDAAISSLLFINSNKGTQVNEESIIYEGPKSDIIKKCIDQLTEYFEGSRKDFDIAVSFSGTSFQQGVWQELANIPYGRTISYLTLSKRLGNVKAIRAVGSANGRNAISIIVPCHRVIGANGELVGYAGDLWRKKWLLDLETKHENGVQTLF